VKERPLLFTCNNSIFCHEEVKTAKKSSDIVCHFKLFRFLREKWQKKAKPTVNSRGILFFKEFAMVILYFKNSYI
jgi:hypothetical protein